VLPAAIDTAETVLDESHTK